MNRPNDKPWYCIKLRALKRKRDRLFRKAKLSKLASDWVTYKRSRNEYAHELSKSVSEHDNKVLNSISTTHQLVYLYHVLGEALDNNKKVRVVFGDISKAFDRVWHAGLLTKLSSIGITGQLNNWFSNYLSGRAQRVVLGSEQSDLMPIKSVPQGSVLGPILFLVYITDIADELECRVSLFTDDNILYIFADTVDECANVLNRDLEEMENWAYTWLVTLVT